MSIAGKLQELDAAKDDIFDAIEAKGVTVPAGSGLADAPALIGSIPDGGGIIPEGFEVKTAIVYTRYDNSSFSNVPSGLIIGENDTVEMLVYLNYSRGHLACDFFTTNTYRALTMHYYYDAQQFRCNGSKTIGVGNIAISEYALLKQDKEKFYYNSISDDFTQPASSTTIKNMMSIGGNNGEIGSSFLWLKIKNPDGIVTHNVVPAKYNNSIYTLDLVTGNYAAILNPGCWTIV